VRATVILPLGRRRALLLARAGAFCNDPSLAEFEFLHVLDRPAARAGAERARAARGANFGLASRLVCLPAGDEPVDPFAAAASVAESDTLVFLGEGVVTDRPGALAAFAGALNGKRDAGLCGGRILNADGSIRCAGLDLLANEDGSLALEAAFAGFPRDFPQASVPRPVFAVSCQAFAMRRSALAAVGGFSPSYMTAAWRDADFCTRVIDAGLHIAYEPRATAIDFSTVRASGLGRDVAARSDAWCFARRWSARIAGWADPGAVEDARMQQAADAPRERSVA
jgi:hypothetical protein